MFHRKSDPIRIQRTILEQEIAQVQREMDLAYSHFDQVVDPDLIDCCIFEVNAVQKRYKYLLQQIQGLQG